MVRMAVFQVVWPSGRLEWEDLDLLELKNTNEEQDEEMHRISRASSESNGWRSISQVISHSSVQRTSRKEASTALRSKKAKRKVERWNDYSRDPLTRWALSICYFLFSLFVHFHLSLLSAIFFLPFFVFSLSPFLSVVSLCMCCDSSWKTKGSSSLLLSFFSFLSSIANINDNG